MNFSQRLYVNKDLRFPQSVKLNNLFKLHYPQGYAILGRNTFVVIGLTNNKALANLRFGGKETVFHTAYLKDVKEK